MDVFHLVSVKHTKPSDKYITLWAPSDRGYCNRLHAAGTYSRSEVEMRPGYYNNGDDTFPAAVAACEEIAVLVQPKWFDDDHGVAIENTPENWAVLKAHRPLPAPVSEAEE